MFQFFKFHSPFKTFNRKITSISEHTRKTRFVDEKKNLIYGGDLSAPTPHGSIGSILFNRMIRMDRREEIFQVCTETETKITTKMFIEGTVAVAEKLKEKGAKKGDFVFLMGNNSINMNMAMVGIFLLAAVPVPLSHKTYLDEFKIILNSIRPKYFGCEQKYIQPFQGILVDLTKYDISNTFLLDSEAEDGSEGFQDFICGRGKDFENFKPTNIHDPKEELALAMKALTFGATGRVVGVTHHNLNSVIARYDDVDDGVIHRHKVTCMVQQVVWMSGIYSLLHSCCYGSKMVVMRWFDEESFLKAVDEHKVTETRMFSTKWWRLYKHNPKANYDLSSFRVGYSIDGPVPNDLVNGLKEKFGLNVVPGYGVTELTGTVLNPENPILKERSVGKLVAQMYGKVVSPTTSQNVAANETGELGFKGPLVTRGYLNNETANRHLFDKDGFLMSGQYGYYEESGEFFIIDAIIHQIKYKNFKISPNELEGIIKTLDHVKDACVTGIVHPNDGEYPIALVVLKKGWKISENEIMAFVNERVPDYKKLRGGVILVSKIPRFRETGTIKRNIVKKVISKYRMKLNKEESNLSQKIDKI